MKNKKSLIIIGIVLIIIVSSIVITSISFDTNKTDNILLEVMNNDRIFIDENKEKTLLKDYKISINHITKPKKYVLIDLDQDKINELVIETTLYSGEYVILRYNKEEEQVYGYNLPYRGFRELKKDGSSSGSSGAAYSTISKIYFEDNILKYNNIVDFNDEEKEYTIDGKKVSREEATNYMKEWRNKESCEWIEVEEIGENTDTSIQNENNLVGVWRDGDEGMYNYLELIIYNDNSVEYTTYYGCSEILEGCKYAGEIANATKIGYLDGYSIILTQAKDKKTGEISVISPVLYRLNMYGSNAFNLSDTNSNFVRVYNLPVKPELNQEIIDRYEEKHNER